MHRFIAASFGAILLATALTSIAVAAPAAPTTSPAVTDTHHDQVTITHAVAPQHAPADRSGIDRTFHPDDTPALTVDQLNAAWNAEVNRVMETPIAGGG